MDMATRSSLIDYAALVRPDRIHGSLCCSCAHCPLALAGKCSVVDTGRCCTGANHQPATSAIGWAGYGSTWNLPVDIW